MKSRHQKLVSIAFLAGAFMASTLLSGCDKKPYVSEHETVVPPEAKIEKTIQLFNADPQAVKFQHVEQGEFNLHKRHGLGGWSKPATRSTEDVSG